MKSQTIMLSFAIVTILALGYASAQASLPAGFQDIEVASGIAFPSAMDFSPDGRLFVSEIGGRVRVIKNDVLLSQPFVSVNAKAQNEAGLLGVTIDPNFTQNRYVYIYYATQPNGVVRLSRFTANATNPDVADPSSETVMLDNITNSVIHVGGGLKFGNDGMLYVTVGDGQFGPNAQNLSTLRGKLLRLDVHNYPNIIPQDNPFLNVSGARPEIWALGLRNPFTLAVDPITGIIFINDVGQDTWEEINLATRGANYGWPTCEGVCNTPGMTNPVYTYNHNGKSASIIGGAFYRGTQFPAEYYGDYFFSDYVLNFLRRMRNGTVSDFGNSLQYSVVSVNMGSDGSLYYLSLNNTAPNSKVRKIIYAPNVNHAPTAVITASALAGPAPLSINFSGTASSDPDNDTLSFSWDFGDGQTGTGPEVSHTYANGVYVATLNATDNRSASDIDTVTISAGVSPPAAEIILPAPGATYIGGQTIDLLSNSSINVTYEWTILFHHGTHDHPVTIINGSSGSFVASTVIETSTDVYYRAILKATDANGLSSIIERDVMPVITTINLQSQPNGATLFLEGVPVTTPYTFQSVVNITRTVEASTLQNFSSKRHVFNLWSSSTTGRINTFGAGLSNITAFYIPAPLCYGYNGTIFGSGYDDYLPATTNGNDVIILLDGNDTVLPGNGDDIVCGGNGTDIVYDVQGTNVVFGDDGIDLLIGGSGVDYLIGGNGTDIIIGMGGNDVMDGGPDGDYLEGNDGNDILLGGGAGDVLVCGAGTDYADGGPGVDNVTACEYTANIP